MSPRSLRWRIYTNIFSRFGETFVIKNNQKKKRINKMSRVVCTDVDFLSSRRKKCFPVGCFSLSQQTD